jgi:hypothetical protein
MIAGRPKKADPGTLYSFAHQFYWDFRRIAEGRTRYRFDHKKFVKLEEEIRNVKLQISDEERAHIEALAEREVDSGRLKRSEKPNWVRNALDSQLAVNRDWLRDQAANTCRKEVRVPGEPDIITELLTAETPERVRMICADAFTKAERKFEPGIVRTVSIPNWPISVGSVLPSYLAQHAIEFIAARKDPRFPRSANRPTSRLKQLWFLSRALAGALFGVSTRTAINLVGSKRPELVFEESRAARPSRKVKKLRKKS